MSKVNFLKSATLAVAGLAVVTSISSCAVFNKKTEEKNSCKATAGKEKHSCKAANGKEKHSCKAAKKEAKKAEAAKAADVKPVEAKKAN